MTLDDYKLWTGETLPLSDEEFERVVAVASGRIASFLCLEKLPDPLPEDLKMVVADFICMVREHQGRDEFVSSKRVRNFTISFKSNAAANAFDQIIRQHGDVLDKYSKCEDTLAVEGNRRGCCGRF